MPLESQLRPAQGLAMNNPNKVALYWLTTAAGAVLFVTFQLFFYVNDFVRGHGATPAITFDPDVLWMFSAFYGCWIVTVLVALIGTRKAQWFVLVFGRCGIGQDYEGLPALQVGLEFLEVLLVIMSGCLRQIHPDEREVRTIH